MSVILHLPFPVSVNQANRFGKNGYYPSEGKEKFFREADGMFLMQKRGLAGQRIEGAFTYHLVLNRKMRHALGDGDNLAKYPIDYAQRVGLIENDKLAEAGSWSWGDCEHGSMLILTAYQPR